MTDEATLPTPSEIIEIHEEIEESYGLKYTGISAHFSEQTLSNVLSDAEEYDSIHLRAAALLRRLISVHIFEDGNKRTAWTATRLYLDQYGTEPAVREPERVATVLRNIQRFDTEELAKWLSNGEIDGEKLNR
ncbi:type II toxin-antitoxin system death-on-curing family toxin [Halorhabdus amylolytica]|uniref:type II toxin-antitoxin system death-on-curing family toxin n=1 Tax=Halorhabdus amylolytica TaxID=2559573 RepID=UPI0010A9C7E4|nr:type II toxin-antitoxin system death-on-curing family toxin [Halorhabdus amylolytica]